LIRKAINAKLGAQDGTIKDSTQKTDTGTTEENNQPGSGQVSDTGSTAQETTKTIADKNKFVKTIEGSFDFGEITEEFGKIIGREAAKIRLRVGDEKSGLSHIENHINDIKAIGFDSVEEFISEITHNFNAIYPSDKENSRALTLVENSGKLKFANIQLELSEDGKFYEIKNATPGRSDQFKNKKPLWGDTGPSATSAKQTLLIPEAEAVGNNISQSPTISNQEAKKSSPVIAVSDIPKGLKIKLEQEVDGKTLSKQVTASKAMNRANQNVAKYEALRAC
jgi:hypothetical protein